MRKSVAVILAASVLSTCLCSCDYFGGSGSGDKDKVGFSHVTETTDELPPLRREPSHDLNSVEVSETFDDFYVEDFDEPWSKGRPLQMASTSVDTYFNHFALDSSYNRVNENLNTVATLTRPVVTSYPADEEGYVIYEVTYVEVFPIVSKESASMSKSFFSYHGVSFLDSYTGTTFPTVNLSTQIDSFCVSGNVFYKGEKYHVSYYEFREDVFEDESSEDLGNGMVLYREKVTITSTSYFIVPEDYDGILMYVYVADDTDTPLEEILAEDNPYYEAPGYFGDDEDIDDYKFFLITAPN